ncbi:MAG: acetyl ornithine aminotransferase family protein [candidate division WOR-3 bacterium]|nr:acetyl ornithine aminotransferase family protein [candidate division WOR-3 bacterium]
MNQPKIITKLPGPKTEKIISKDNKYLSSSLTRLYPAVIEKGEGCWVWDVDGNRFLDFTSGIGVGSTGHCHPLVVESIKKQSECLIHMSGTDFYYPIQVKLAEKIAEIIPGGMNYKVFFCNSGTEAVEGALKLARHFTKRNYVLAFLGSFHGRTLGSLSLTSSKSIQRQGFGSLLPNVIHVPYGYCYRCVFNLEYPSCNFACIEYIEKEVFGKLVPAEEVGSIFVEPIQGESGVIVPPPNYFSKLRELCDRYQILLVIDEVQSGMGRTGKMFAIEHWKTMADIYCIAKGIASGMPLGAFAAKSSVMNWQPGAHASTFGGNPVACAAALTTIRLLEQKLIENAETVGKQMLENLKDLQKRFDFIGDVRGKGLMIGVELVESSSKKPLTEKRNGVLRKAFEKGLLLLGAGASVVRFLPPLILLEQEANTGLEIFEQALKEVFRK